HSHYPPPPNISTLSLHDALPISSFSVQDTLDFFAAEDVATKVEETGKIFPVSDKATDVLDALLRRLARSGATLALAEPVLEVGQDRKSTRLNSSHGSISYAVFCF